MFFIGWGWERDETEQVEKSHRAGGGGSNRQKRDDGGGSKQDGKMFGEGLRDNGEEK